MFFLPSFSRRGGARSATGWFCTALPPPRHCVAPILGQEGKKPLATAATKQQTVPAQFSCSAFPGCRLALRCTSGCRSLPECQLPPDPSRISCWACCGSLRALRRTSSCRNSRERRRGFRPYRISCRVRCESLRVLRRTSSCRNWRVCPPRRPLRLPCRNRGRPVPGWQERYDIRVLWSISLLSSCVVSSRSYSNKHRGPGFPDDFRLQDWMSVCHRFVSGCKNSFSPLLVRGGERFFLVPILSQVLGNFSIAAPQNRKNGSFFCFRLDRILLT